MKTTFVSTVYNEENTIDEFIRSILTQTEKIDEVIVVDGGSTDNTIEKLKKYKSITVMQKSGNRSICRNFGITQAKHEIILLSDAGCILDKNWAKNIREPFKNSHIDVVAGYYSSKPKSPFQEAIIPYVFVMKDKVHPQHFLPATRSMALRKNRWKLVGKFNEKLSHNEDFEFAKRLQKSNVKFIFQPHAIVYWIPRSTITQAFWMFFRFAYGDAEAMIFRPKVLFIFLRYIVGVVWLWMGVYFHSVEILLAFLINIILYIDWAASKNSRYVSSKRALIFLPIIQIVSDTAILFGTVCGLFGFSLFSHDTNKNPAKK